jgi:hypothetical protein
MEHFKIEFLAIVALASMSFTIAKHSVTFKNDTGTCNIGDDTLVKQNDFPVIGCFQEDIAWN